VSDDGPLDDDGAPVDGEGHRLVEEPLKTALGDPAGDGPGPEAPAEGGSSTSRGAGGFGHTGRV